MTQTTIDMDGLREMFNRNQPVTVLDVRHTGEWAEWTIPGSINVDVYNALKVNDPAAMAGVDLSPDRPVVTI